MERLQKVIANSGYASRRKAEELIKQGKVAVNGKVVTELGTKVNPTDKITVEGKMLERDIPKVYILLNKPRGFVTTTKDEKGRKTVVDLIDIETRVYPVGRLDYDTTGLLLLTNDGELTNLLLHPSNEIDKVYVAKVKGEINSNVIQRLRRGVVIDGVKTSPAKVRTLKLNKKDMTGIVEITIHEGRNHQVKKMFAAVGCEVLKLKREKMAFLDLRGVKSGEYRYLNTKEVKRLYALCKK